MKKIGVMTSGGDCPGMNACIRSVARTALAKGIKVMGIEQGYLGLIQDKIRPLGSIDVANTIHRGGTFLRSARCLEFKTEEGQKKALENMKKHGIDGLVVIGGDGSLTGAKILHDMYGVKVVGVPGSIDNDLAMTNMSIGVDTALNRIIYALDAINDTASSHDRTFLVEVMGRNCGYLAMMSAIASGAEAVLIPEIEYDLDGIIKKIKQRYNEGKTRSIIIVAEGVGSANDFGKTIQLMGGFDTRIIVLGHIQRGGSPTVFDRILATRMGDAAVNALLDGESGVMTSLDRRDITVVKLDDVLGKRRNLDEKIMQIAENLSR